MRLERTHGWFLIGVAVWNAVIWVTFAANLYDAYAAGEDRPQGYWGAHSVLIVVNLVLGAVFVRWGTRILRGLRTP
ncbi:MAG: hypothetical protein LH468_06820 [Nocardioides sp.]|nr:hypothetical protein [Nocardioides sp.]